MLSVPPSQTAYTGMDAFSTPSNRIWPRAAGRRATIWPLEAVSLITKYLPIAVKDGGNIEARTKLAWANTEAGICESLSCCISHHSMEHALSAYFPNVPHGAGLTMLSVAYFGYLAERNPNRFPDLARAMGEKIDGLSKKEQAMTFITGLKKLIRKVGLKEHKLSEFGVRQRPAQDGGELLPHDGQAVRADPDPTDGRRRHFDL